MSHRTFNHRIQHPARPRRRYAHPGACDRRRFLASAALVSGGSLLLASCAAPAPPRGGKGPEETTPPVAIPHAVIRMQSPNSALFGITTDGVLEITLEDVVRVHGYCAGGAAFAFRLAAEAFRALYGDRMPVRQDIRVQTSHHCCQAMALAYITGARTDFGAFRSRGDLVLIPEQERRAVFTDKPSGKTVAFALALNPHDTFEPLFKKAIANPEFAPEVRRALNEKIEEYLTAPAERLFTIL